MIEWFLFLIALNLSLIVQELYTFHKDILKIIKDKDILKIIKDNDEEEKK